MATLILGTVSLSGHGAERDVVNSPVPVVLDGRFAVAADSGTFAVPIKVSRDWTQPQADVTRAVVVIHGWPRRDLDSGEQAASAAGTDADHAIVVTPQFLTRRDVDAHALPSDVLHWKESDWLKGQRSDDGASVGSFAIIDLLLARLSDRRIFPNLKLIVLAGHSAGGQFVQRYAAIGRGEAALQGPDIHIRYVVANPATYLYLDDQRPSANGGFARFDAAACPSFDDWNHGLHGKLPRDFPASTTPADVKATYLRRDVVYLLGTADNDPAADALDRSCAAEVQGATRHARGLAFAAYIRHLDPATTQRVLEVPGVAHRTTAMYASPCGLAALFDTAGCHVGE